MPPVLTVVLYYYEVASVVSDSVRPHRWQPTRLSRPWDSPGKTVLGNQYINYQEITNFNIKWPSFQIYLVQSLSCIWLFETPWAAACQASLSFTNSQSLLKLMSVELVMPSISSCVVPFSSRLQSFPASGSFPISQFFASGGQSTGASASVLPKNTQSWFSFRIDWFDLLVVQGTLKSLLHHHSSKLSLVLNFLYGPTLTSIHDYCKNHSFD